MVQISNNGWILMNRGDSFELPLFIGRGAFGTPVRFNLKENPPNKVYLGVMEPNQPFEYAIIRKTYDVQSDDTHPPMTKEGDLLIKFAPKDTEYLMPGKYFYEIKLEYKNGDVDTIVPKTEFVIVE